MPVDEDDEVFLNFKRGLVSCDAFHFSRIDRNFNFVDPLENSAEVTYRVEYVVHKCFYNSIGIYCLCYCKTAGPDRHPVLF